MSLSLSLSPSIQLLTKCGFYIPSKPNKYGLKVHALSDAKTFYTAEMEIYAGKQLYKVDAFNIPFVHRLR